MRCVLIAALCCVLPACGAAGADHEVKWRTLADGSKAYVRKDSDMFETVERCWPDSSGFDCLLLSGLHFDSTGGTSWTAERRHSSTLTPGNQSSRGYWCNVDEQHLLSSRFDEAISTETNQDLLKNDVEYGGAASPWTAKFVTDFMRENGLEDAAPYFNCEGLERIIDSGSGVTLATTAATREQLFGSTG